MNYIKQLEMKARDLGAIVGQTEIEIVRFQTFLNGPKFTGTENGERKDWIATADVITWLRELRSALH